MPQMHTHGCITILIISRIRSTSHRHAQTPRNGRASDGRRAMHCGSPSQGNAVAVGLCGRLPPRPTAHHLRYCPAASPTCARTFSSPFSWRLCWTRMTSTCFSAFFIPPPVGEHGVCEGWQAAVVGSWARSWCGEGAAKVRRGGEGGPASHSAAHLSLSPPSLASHTHRTNTHTRAGASAPVVLPRRCCVTQASAVCVCGCVVVGFSKSKNRQCAGGQRWGAGEQEKGSGARRAVSTRAVTIKLSSGFSTRPSTQARRDTDRGSCAAAVPPLPPHSCGCACTVYDKLSNQLKRLSPSPM